MREVVMFRHRADIRLAPGRVIEFQHSSLSVDEIWERERFYGPGLTWVFDTIEAVESERLHLRAKRGPHHRYRTFRWKHPRRSIIHCRRPVFLNLGQGWLLHLQFMGGRAPYGGCGRLITVDEFLPRTS